MGTGRLTSLNKIIVTGANGAGKSYFAKTLVSARPGVPLISFDALKLTSGWQRRPRSQIEADLRNVVQGPAWILEGGPSMLEIAMEFADALVWLDTPAHIRGWRLFVRPWKHLGRTRAEIPSGNTEWPWQQTKFAYHSLRNEAAFRNVLSKAFEEAGPVQKWRCRTGSDRDEVARRWAASQL